MLPLVGAGAPNQACVNGSARGGESLKTLSQALLAAPATSLSRHWPPGEASRSWHANPPTSHHHQSSTLRYMPWLSTLKRASALFPPLLSKTSTPSPIGRRSLASIAAMANRDPTTLSNYAAWRTKHTTVDFKLDFDAKLLRGSATLQLESQTDRQSKEVILDTRFVKVHGVSVNDAKSQWDLKSHSDPFGAPLHVSVPEGAAKGDVVNVSIDLETTDKCTALQWLTPAQTSNKKHPYMFSQCQAINARSIFPCQDTPDVKSTFTFRLTSSLPVVASGVPVGDHTPTPGTEKTYEFDQKVPIPSYLFAVASGDIVSAKIGSRSVVVTSPNELDDCKWELERDMDKFMDVAEKLVFPYKWGEYNVLVLPPSFPYGGGYLKLELIRTKGVLTRWKAWRTLSIPLPPRPSSLETVRMSTSLRTS